MAAPETVTLQEAREAAQQIASGEMTTDQKLTYLSLLAGLLSQARGAWEFLIENRKTLLSIYGRGKYESALDKHCDLINEHGQAVDKLRKELNGN